MARQVIFVDPEAIMDLLNRSRKPISTRRISQLILGGEHWCPSVGTLRALAQLERELRIQMEPWLNGHGWISLEKDQMLHQYKILADIDKHNKDYTIETDERNQALKLALTFSKNWRNVRVQFSGVTYFWPNLEKLP